MRPVISRMNSGAAGAGLVAVFGRLCASGDAREYPGREKVSVLVLSVYNPRVTARCRFTTRILQRFDDHSIVNTALFPGRMGRSKRGTMI